jgi:hypothetical protein
MSKEATQQGLVAEVRCMVCVLEHSNGISSFVAEESIGPGGPTILAAMADVDAEVTIFYDTTNKLTKFFKETTNSGCPPPINMPDPLLDVDDNPPQQELEPAQQ